MLVNDANGKHLVAPGVLYVIQKYVYIYKKGNRQNVDNYIKNKLILCTKHRLLFVNFFFDFQRFFLLRQKKEIDNFNYYTYTLNNKIFSIME